MGQACYGENRENNKNYMKSLVKKSSDLGLPFDDENQPDINEVYDEIEQAKQNNDVKTLLKYLLNDRQIEQNLDCNHEWALPPKTIGSLATYYIFQLLFHNQNSQSIEIDQENLNLLEQEEDQDRLDHTILVMVHLGEMENFKQIMLKQQLINILLPQINQESNASIDYKCSLCCVMREISKNNQDNISKILQSQQVIDFLKDIIQNNKVHLMVEGLSCCEELIFDEKQPKGLNAKGIRILKKNNFQQILQISLKILHQLEEEGEQQDLNEMANSLIFTLNEKFAIILQNP